jgi:hypothetical protein
MTSASSASFGMDGHPEVTEISDLTEGLLPPERSADVRAHLSGCELCTDVRTSLEEIRSALGTLPGPARMPSDVAGRIDAALAAEALLDASAPGRDGIQNASPAPSSSDEPAAVSRGTDSRDAVSRETVHPGRTAGRSTGRPAGRPRGAGGPGRSGDRRPRRWRTALLGTAGAAALLTLGALFLPDLGADPSSGQAKEESASDAAGSDWTDEALEVRVRSLLAGNKTGEPGRESQGSLKKAESGAPDFSTKASPESPDTHASTVPLCIREGINRSEAPLAVGMGVHEGRQAYIVVLPHGDDGSRVDAYVVDADCVDKTPSSPGTVLTTRTYPR